MKGPDIYDVLNGIGATHLHHANSVTTSCTFLEQGGLLSRSFVEARGLRQTDQFSDKDDKKYGIWDDIFLDHVDTHGRGGRTKGQNKYGPVLFVFDLKILQALPLSTDVRVTKRNPIHWRDGESTSDWWYESAAELAADIKLGDFDKMLVVRTPSHKLNFPNRQAPIFLDDPKRQLSSGEDAYRHAENRLRAASSAGGIRTSIQPHTCRGDCVCIQKYAKFTAANFDHYFI
jgi:hypothetical protein